MRAGRHVAGRAVVAAGLEAESLALAQALAWSRIFIIAGAWHGLLNDSGGPRSLLRILDGAVEPGGMPPEPQQEVPGACSEAQQHSQHSEVGTPRHQLHSAAEVAAAFIAASAAQGFYPGRSGPHSDPHCRPTL